MHSAFHSVSLQSKVNISQFSIVHVVLVQHVVQALIQVFQVKQDHGSSSLHANFDLVDVPANLYKSLRLDTKLKE